VRRRYAWLRVGEAGAGLLCARSVRPGRSHSRTRDHAEFPGTVDLAHSGADLDFVARLLGWSDLNRLVEWPPSAAPHIGFVVANAARDSGW
jgi:hypothetical protein